MSQANVYHAFQNTLGNCRFTFSKGKDANFLSGEYLTNNQAEIDELNAEVAAGHPHIYIKTDRVTVDTTYVDPLEAIKARAVEEYKASLAASLDKSNDRGNSEFSGKLEGIANSTTVAEGMSDSTSTDSSTAMAPTAMIMPTMPTNTARVITAGKK